MISSNEITAFYLVLSFSITYVLGKILLRTLWRPRLHRDVVMDDCAADRGYKHFDPYSGIGLLLLIIRAYRGRRFLEMWEGLSIQLGHTFSFWLLGERIFVTSDPENVKVLLSSSFDTFEHGPSRRYAGKPLIGNGIFAVDGVEWSAARALLRPSFAKSQISDFDMLEHHFRNFLQALPVDGAAVDLQELFKCLSMDVITDMLFGTSTNSLTQSNDDEAVAFSDACEYSQKIVWRNFSLGWVGTFLPNPKDRKSRRLLHNTVNRYVRQVLQQESQLALPVHPDSNSGRKKYVFLEHLVERTRDPRVIRDQLMSALLGGRDTTSSLLSNLFHVLARKPDIWDRLRAEIRQIQNQPPTMEDIQRSKYARNCIQESLRLHPVVPTNQRWSKAATTLPCGRELGKRSPFAIPQGSNVYIAVYTMHRRKDIYGADADVFRPERWEELHPGWGFVPFGGGPRLCIGQEFAMTESMYILIRMLQAFDTVRPADNEPWRENLSITLNSASGCNVFLRRIKAEYTNVIIGDMKRRNPA